MWVEHTRRHGWKAVAAVQTSDDPGEKDLTDAPMVGVAYGYCGAPDQWWQQQVVAGLRRSGADAAHIATLMTSYFELTELHILPTAQGRGLGEALIRRLLDDRDEDHVLLSTPRSTARRTGPGGSTAGWASATSSVATTSPEIRGRSRSWAALCRCRALIPTDPRGRLAR